MNKEDTMILVYVNKDGKVSLTELTDEGKVGLDDEENFSPAGHWEEWEDYMEPEELLSILAERLGV